MSQSRSRLLKATPEGRKRLFFADNLYNVYVDGVGVSFFRKLACAFSVSLGWFECFALQNLQAFSKYKVTNVNVYTKLKSNFVVRMCLYFIYERIRSCVGFQIFSYIINFINAAFKPLSFNQFCTL